MVCFPKFVVLGRNEMWEGMDSVSGFCQKQVYTEGVDVMSREVSGEVLMSECRCGRNRGGGGRLWT